TALTWLHLDVMDDRTNWDRRKRHCVAWLYVYSLVGSNHLVTSSKTLWRENVSLFAVCICYERDECGTVRVIFQTLYCTFNVELTTLEVDKTVGPLVTAALETNGDPTSIV